MKAVWEMEWEKFREELFKEMEADSEPSGLVKWMEGILDRAYESMKLAYEQGRIDGVVLLDGVDVLLGLDKVHLDIIDGLIPFFGKTREEVIKYMVINWMKKNKMGMAKKHSDVCAFFEEGFDNPSCGYFVDGKCTYKKNCGWQER